MALKALMLRKRIDLKTKELEALNAKSEELEQRSAELETAISELTEDCTQEERDAVTEAIDAHEAEKNELTESKDVIEREIEQLETELDEEEKKQAEAEKVDEPEVEERKDNTIMDERKFTEAEMQERAAFVNYVKGIEQRDDYNMTEGNNGVVVPKTIAAEIITKVKEISPIVNMAHVYNVKGTLEVPYYEASSDHVIAAAYKDEMAELEAASGDFGAVELTGFEIGALAKISRKLINNTDVNVEQFIVDQLAQAFAAKLEMEAINGTNGKVTGLLAGVTNEVTATAKTYVTADDLIKLQDSIPDALQNGACWIMTRATRSVIRQLKDSNGRYLLNDDLNSPFGYTLLGKPVYCSENMPELGTSGNKAIVYGDMSGLAYKVSEALEIEVLREKFATQHAIGVVGWTEIDAKVENAQKLAVLKCKASDPTNATA